MVLYWILTDLYSIRERDRHKMLLFRAAEIPETTIS